MPPYTFGDSGISDRYFDIYLRAQAAYTRPTSQSDLTTLLGTCEKIGQVENKNAKLVLEPVNMVETGDGNETAGSQQGTLEGKCAGVGRHV